MAKSKAQTHQTNGLQLSYSWNCTGISYVKNGLNLVLKLDEPLTCMTVAYNNIDNDVWTKQTYVVGINVKNRGKAFNIVLLSYLYKL